MLSGTVMSIISPDESKAQSAASLIAKLNDRGPLLMYYKKLEESLLLSVIVPTEYPASIINSAAAVSLSDVVVVLTGYEIDWRDGELLTLADASGAQKTDVYSESGNLVKELISKSGIKASVAETLDAQSLLDLAKDHRSDDEGYVFVDRAFTVKGVGPVVLGYTKTKVYVHDKLLAVPIMKWVEVKSIEVLDEEQDSVGPGVRIGFALKGAEAEELKDVYALVKDQSSVVTQLSGTATIYPWADMQTQQVHIIGGGSAVVSQISRSNEKVEVKLSKPMPKLKRYLILNVNARPKRSRVAGYLVSED